MVPENWLSGVSPMDVSSSKPDRRFMSRALMVMGVRLSSLISRKKITTSVSIRQGMIFLNCFIIISGVLICFFEFTAHTKEKKANEQNHCIIRKAMGLIHFVGIGVNDCRRMFFFGSAIIEEGTCFLRADDGAAGVEGKGSLFISVGLKVPDICPVRFQLRFHREVYPPIVHDIP